MEAEDKRKQAEQSKTSFLSGFGGFRRQPS